MIEHLALPVLFSFTEMFNDFNFILKIFVVMALVNFVKNHIGGGPVALAVTAVAAIIIFFSNMWILFGGAFLLYSLFMFGIGSMIIDFLFVGGASLHSGAPSIEGMESPVSAGADLQHRMHQMSHKPHMRPPMRGPPGAGGG